MEGKGRSLSNKKNNTNIEDDMELRRGPWTVEEDFNLINYIATHGEGRWNSLARCAGLKRTGKSCRLRWLNYLRPDVRRGNITLEEQLMILELHSRWGNRWSKIAQYLPGRTDNEIKNYWRTRVQKHAKQLKCDVNSKQFKDTMRYLWMPRLVERIQAAAASTTTPATSTAAISATSSIVGNEQFPVNMPSYGINNNMGSDIQYCPAISNYNGGHVNITNPNNYSTPENSSSAVSPASDLTEYYSIPVINDPNPDYIQGGVGQMAYNSENLIGPSAENYFMCNGIDDFQAMEQDDLWFNAVDSSNSLWNVDQDLWFSQQQQHLNNGTM